MDRRGPTARWSKLAGGSCLSSTWSGRTERSSGRLRRQLAWAACASEWKIAPLTCMGGMCINICAEGLCNCRFPFYVFPPESGTTKEEKVGYMTKI